QSTSTAATASAESSPSMPIGGYALSLPSSFRAMRSSESISTACSAVRPAEARTRLVVARMPARTLRRMSDHSLHIRGRKQFAAQLTVLQFLSIGLFLGESGPLLG